MFIDKKFTMFFFSESGFNCLKISEILVKMHTFGKAQLITPWPMCKRVQEGDAQKQRFECTYRKKKITWQHLIGAQISYFYVYTKKENNIPSFSYLNLMQHHLHKFVPN